MVSTNNKSGNDAKDEKKSRNNQNTLSPSNGHSNASTSAAAANPSVDTSDDQEKESGKSFIEALNPLMFMKYFDLELLGS